MGGPFQLRVGTAASSRWDEVAGRGPYRWYVPSRAARATPATMLLTSAEGPDVDRWVDHTGGPYSGPMSGVGPDEGESRRRRREPTDADVQREWEQITAGLTDLAGLGATDAEPTPPAREGRDPSTPDQATDEESRPPSSTSSGPPRIGDLPASTPGAGSRGPRDYAVPEDEEDEGYTPPEPPPIGGGDPLPTLAWSMALGGPILTVLLLIFWTAAPPWLYLSAGGASLAGWLVLFWRMPKGRRDSDDDNGAVL